MDMPLTIAMASLIVYEDNLSCYLTCFLLFGSIAMDKIKNVVQYYYQ